MAAPSQTAPSNTGSNTPLYEIDGPPPPTEYEVMYPTNHLFVLSPTNPFRKLCVKIGTSKPFDFFILLAIVVNCVFMAMNAPLPRNDKNEMNILLESFEIYLLGIFVVECLLKIVCQGFLLHPDAYLRNAWNILDFVVVVTGVLGIPSIGRIVGFEDAGPMKVIKAARVLRPLKLVSGVPSLQVVMSAILKSMASLLQICLLIGFVIVMYGIVGLSLLQGKFHFTCFYTNTTVIAEEGRLCPSQPCPDGTECKEYWIGPNSGITSFDNILIACLTVFVCITCEGWTDTMYWTFDVADFDKYYMWLYYCTLNVIGAQFMLNLVCGVLSGEFSKEKERVENRAAFLAERAANAAAERAAENYEEWMDQAEQLKAEEDAKRRKQWLAAAAAAEEEGEEPPAVQMTAIERFKLKNSIIRTKLKAIMLSSFMYWLVIFIVFCNSVSGAVQHYQQPQWLSDIIAISDLIFLAFFFCEMCLKIYALGPSLYFASKFNKFDFVVVISGIGNMLMSKLYGINLGIPVLRQLRLMRLFKFTRYWTGLKMLIASILASMTSILSLLLLLFLFLMIFALLGMQLFGGSFKSSIPPSRTNFDDFFNAMLAVFQIITGEDWNYVMYEGVIAYGGAQTPKGLAVSLYFVGVTVLGNYVLLNVFLAIAVDNLTMSAEEEEEIQAEEEAREEHMQEVKEKYAPPGQAPAKASSAVQEAGKAAPDHVEVVVGEFDKVPKEGGTQAPMDGFLDNLKEPGRMTGNIFQPQGAPIMEENTLFICAPTNIIRRVIHKIVSSQYFDNVILALILISSGLLALEDATDPNAPVNLVLKYLDYFFTPVFALEVVLKIINYGFALHPGSYCRDTWNIADMVVVLCAITSLILSADKNASPTVKQIIKILRILRVMRPLKSINKLPKLKAVFQCMLSSLKNVVNILMITLQFLFIFSVMGVQLFSGKLWYCNDESKEWEGDCQGRFIDFEEFNYNRPMEVEREWTVYDFNFDNVPLAMIALFTSSTGEGWPAVMQTGIDSQEESQGPILNNKIWISIYFIIFVIIFSFFFINVFVGMIILTFQEQSAAEATGTLDRNTKNSFIFAMSSKPLERFMPVDVKSWQYKAWALVESNPWELMVMGLISLNTVILMVEFYDQPKFYENILGQINEAFTFIFTFEFAVKMFAFGCNYFKDGWNNFDMLIVGGSLMDFAIKSVLPPGTIDFDPSIFRLFRAARLVKLLRRSRSLRILLWTFLQSFKALPYVGMLIFLLFFVYGIVGVQLFGLIAIDSEDDPWAQINRNNHFRSYFAATQVLFRVATGENWPNIMLACTAKARCDKQLPAVEPGQETCGNDIAYLYFLSFVFFCSFLVSEATVN